MNQPASKPVIRIPLAWNSMIYRFTVLAGVFGVGLLLLVVRQMGLHLSVIPGVYGDTRLQNFLLEHVFRWITGLDKSLWDTGSFYPYPLTLAFSDNLFGVAPFYMLFRWVGLDQETALQGWILAGFFLNFASSAFVLTRLHFRAEPTAVGAFFFTFGLPMLAQISHLQLLYRFCVPIACYELWQFATQPRLSSLAGVFCFTFWQIYAGIYMGVFLAFLLCALIVFIPFSFPRRSGAGVLSFWPVQLKTAWLQAKKLERAAVVLLLAGLSAGLGFLFRPYLLVQEYYGFERSWTMVSSMLPRVQSYFVADQLRYWKSISSHLWGMPTMRNEHQLFPGWAVYAFVALGLVMKVRGPGRKVALAHLLAVLLLVILTLDMNDFSLWRVVYAIPGLNSIRSVTRVQLVLMWPLGLFCAYSAESILQAIPRKTLALGVAGLLIAVVFIEPLLWTNPTQFSKLHAQERLVELRNKLPAILPENPILFLAVKPDESFVVSEMDGMLLAQSLGWTTLNGYFGNFPPGYHPATSCQELPSRILHYMQFAQIKDEAYYLALIRRVVPLGFTDCDPTWWQKMPALPAVSLSPD